MKKIVRAFTQYHFSLNLVIFVVWMSLVLKHIGKIPYCMTATGIFLIVTNFINILARHLGKKVNAWNLEDFSFAGIEAVNEIFTKHPFETLKYSETSQLIVSELGSKFKYLAKQFSVDLHKINLDAEKSLFSSKSIDVEVVKDLLQFQVHVMLEGNIFIYGVEVQPNALSVSLS